MKNGLVKDQMKKIIFYSLLFLLFMLGILGYITLFSPGVVNNIDLVSPFRTQEGAFNSETNNPTPPLSTFPDSDIHDTQSNFEASLHIHVAFSLSPLENTVFVNLLDANQELISREEISASTTDVQHTFQSLQNNATYTVIASARGFLSSRHTVTLESPDTNVSLVLHQNPWLTIQCADQNGVPVPGAEMDIRSDTQGVFTAQIQANDRGSAQIELPYPGVFTVFATHPLIPGIVNKIIRVESNPNHHILVLSKLAGMIHGKVTDSNDAPIPGAKLFLHRFSKHNRIAETETNSDGLFAFSDLSLAEYFVSIDAGEDYIKNQITYSEYSKEDVLFPRVVLTPDQPYEEFHFRLSPSVILHGQVIDSGNRPIPGALIKAGIQGPRPTSIRPLFQDVATNLKGEFKLPITTRLDHGNQLQVSALHPDYGSVNKIIEDYTEWPAEERITLIMGQNLGTLKGTVIDSTSNDPVVSLALNLIPNHFRGVERFQKKATTDERGDFEITLSEGKYQVKAQGYTILSPQLLYVNRADQTQVTLRAEKEDENKITLRGLVVNQDQIPIHGANVYVYREGRTLGGTETTPEGQFELDIEESALQTQSSLHVIHKLHQEWKISLREIANLEEIVAELAAHQGTVKVTLHGISLFNDVRVHLMKPQYYDPLRTVEEVKQSVVYLSNIDENQGPYFLLASSQHLFGISPPFNLADAPSRFLEVDIPMTSKNSEAALTIQVLDSQTGDPLSIATCELDAVSMNPYGSPMRYQRRAVTFDEGLTTFTQVPVGMGWLKIRHVYYQEISIPFFHDGSSVEPIKIFYMEKRNF